MPTTQVHHFCYLNVLYLAHVTLNFPELEVTILSSNLSVFHKKCTIVQDNRIIISNFRELVEDALLSPYSSASLASTDISHEIMDNTLNNTSVSNISTWKAPSNRSMNGKYEFEIQDNHFRVILLCDDELKMTLFEVAVDRVEDATVCTIPSEASDNMNHNAEITSSQNILDDHLDVKKDVQKSLMSTSNLPEAVTILKSSTLNKVFESSLSSCQSSSSTQSIPVNALRRVLVEKLLQFQIDRINELERQNRQLSDKASQRDEALKQVSLAIREKNELERESYSKFIKLLNAKKERIRLLDNEVKRITSEKVKLVQKLNQIEAQLKNENEEKKVIRREARKLHDEVRQLEQQLEDERMLRKIQKSREIRAQMDESTRKRKLSLTGKNDESPIPSTTIDPSLFISPEVVPNEKLLHQETPKQLRNQESLDPGDLLDMLEEF